MAEDLLTLKNSIEEQTKAIRDLTAILQRSLTGGSGGGAALGSGSGSGGGSLGSSPIGGGGGPSGGGASSPPSSFGLASIGHAINAVGTAGGSQGLQMAGALAAGAAGGPVGFATAVAGIAATSVLADFQRGQRVTNAGLEATSGAVGLTEDQVRAKAKRAEDHQSYLNSAEADSKNYMGSEIEAARREHRNARSIGEIGAEQERRAQTDYERGLTAEQKARGIVEDRYARKFMYGHVGENDPGLTSSYERALRDQRRLQNNRGAFDHIVSHVNQMPNLDRMNSTIQGNAAKKANGP